MPASSVSVSLCFCLWDMCPVLLLVEAAAASLSVSRDSVLGTGLGSSSWAAETRAGAAGAGDHVSYVTQQCYDNTC